jgi:hypothetical protein
MRLDGNHPEQNRVYRCHVCRLELMLDEDTKKLTVAPLPSRPDSEPRQRQLRD